MKSVLEASSLPRTNSEMTTCGCSQRGQLWVDSCEDVSASGLGHS